MHKWERGEESEAVVAFMVLLKSALISWCLVLLHTSALTPTIAQSQRVNLSFKYHKLSLGSNHCSMHSPKNSKERDVFRTQPPPKWVSGIHSCFLCLPNEAGFALLCTFVASVSISELAQLNAVGCGVEGVSNNQDFGRSICRTHSLQHCC